MSLDWDLTGIEDYEELCWIPDPDGATHEDGRPRKTLSVITEAIIWLTISTGIGEITDKTAEEFYARSVLIGKLYGPAYYEDGEGRQLTVDQIRQHKGLRTNVFPQESETKFVKRHAAGVLRDARREYQRETERAATPA